MSDATRKPVGLPNIAVSPATTPTQNYSRPTLKINTRTTKGAPGRITPDLLGNVEVDVNLNSGHSKMLQAKLLEKRRTKGQVTEVSEKTGNSASPSVSKRQSQESVLDYAERKRGS